MLVFREEKEDGVEGILLGREYISEEDFLNISGVDTLSSFQSSFDCMGSQLGGRQGRQGAVTWQIRAQILQFEVRVI